MACNGSAEDDGIGDSGRMERAAFRGIGELCELACNGQGMMRTETAIAATIMEAPQVPGVGLCWKLADVHHGEDFILQPYRISCISFAIVKISKRL